VLSGNLNGEIKILRFKIWSSRRNLVVVEGRVQGRLLYGGDAQSRG
jgi:hypothetical protein